MRPLTSISDVLRVQAQVQTGSAFQTGPAFTASFSNSNKKMTSQTVRALPHFPLLPSLREYFPQLNANAYNGERLQHIISRWTRDDPGQAIIAQMTHGIHSEAVEMNTGVVSRR